MKAIVATHPGGPEVLEFTDVPEPTLAPDEVLVEAAAIGLNYIDTYRRSGVYKIAFPHTPGTEGAGRIVAVGDGVDAQIGALVAFSGGKSAYAEKIVVPAGEALPVPDGMDAKTAAALPLQGMTAHYLAASTFPIQPGHIALVHAAAGGVGGLLTQLVVARGGKVIATAGTEEKAAIATDFGAHDVIIYTELADLTADLPRLVRSFAGDGVDVVYDGVGKATFDASLASLARRGMLVLYGGASGQVPPFDIQLLNAAGSCFLTRPTLGDYVVTREERLWRWNELTEAVLDGRLRVPIGAEFPLADAADAHRALEGRQTTGKVLLIP